MGKINKLIIFIWINRFAKKERKKR